MRYEQEILEKIMYYDTEGVMSSFPLYIYRLKEDVRREALEAAVVRAVLCHPRFGCRPAEDAQGPYLETNPEPPVIPELSPEKEYIFGGEINHHYPWIVGIRGREIIYTGWHGLADGMGATAFALACLFVLLCGYNRMHMTNHFLSDVCFGVMNTSLLTAGIVQAFLRGRMDAALPAADPEG